MVNTKDKENYKISKETMIKELKKEYGENVLVCDTFLEQDKDRWRRGYHLKFEQLLQKNGLYHFAYIKFYLDGDNKYALVAGKTGSLHVNSRGNDVRFREYPYEGKAKEWLYKNQKKWCQTEILAIKTKAQGEASKQEAFAIEKNLIETFGLLKS